MPADRSIDLDKPEDFFAASRAHQPKNIDEVMTRLIARLDIKNDFVIKGIQLEGSIVGDPNQMANRYYSDGIDEIVFMDAVASLYDRNNLFDVISQAAKMNLCLLPWEVGCEILMMSSKR